MVYQITPVLDAELLSTAVSEKVTFEDYATVAIVATQPSSVTATLLVNGVVSGLNVTVNEGDELQVSMMASGQFNDPRHAVLLINGEDSTSFTCVTKSDATQHLNYNMAQRDPFEIDRDQDDVAYVPHPANNQIQVRTGALTSAPVAAISIARPVLDAVDSSNPKSLVCSYHDGYVHEIDQIERRVVRSIATAGKPFEAIRFQHPGTGRVETWVTVSDKSYISVYDSAGVLINTIITGNRPLGIAVSDDRRHVWIANNADSTLLHLQWNGASWARNTVQVGARPYKVAVDDTGNAYVTCAMTERVFRVDTSNTPSSIQVGRLPRGIVRCPSGLWVAVSGEAKIVRISNTEVLDEVTVGLMPFAIGCSPSGNVVVSCFGTQELVEANSNGVLSRTTTRKYAYDLFSVGGDLWEVSQWSGTPSYIFVQDRHPHDFSLDDPLEVPRGRVSRTNEFPVMGINAPTWASVIPVHDAVLYLNGAPVEGGRTQVVKGDKLQVSYRAPEEPGTLFQAGLFVGSNFDYVNTVSSSARDQIDGFTVPDMTSAALDQEFTSAAVVISGLESPEMTSLLSISAGSIILNGSHLNVVSVPVKNGDRVQFRMRSATTYSTPRHVLIRVGAFEEVWTTFTHNDPGEPTFYNEASQAGKSLYQLIGFDKMTRGHVNPELNFVLKYDPSTFDLIENYRLDGLAVGGVPMTKNYTYVLDVMFKQVLVVDPYGQNPGLRRVYDLEDAPHGIAAGPAVAMGSVPTRHYVTLPNKDKIIQLGSTQVLNMQTGSHPMGIAVNNYNKMFVACDDGFLHSFNYNEATQRFVFDTITGIPDGGRLQDILLDESNTFVSDISSGTVHKLVNGMYLETIKVGHLPYAMCQSDTHIYVANFGSASISMFPKNSGVNAVREIELPAGGSQPTGIMLDKARNRIMVCCSRDQMMFEYNATDMSFVRWVKLAGHVWSMQMSDAGHVLALSMWGNLLFTRSVGRARNPMTSMLFNQQLNLDLNEEVTSNEYRMTANLVRPERIWIEPFTDSTMLRNGVPVGHDAVFSANDVLHIRSAAAPTYDTKRGVGVFAYKHRTEFVNTTTKDVFPDFINFPTIQNAIPRDLMVTEHMEISGLDPSVLVEIRPRMDADLDEAAMTLFKNGEKVDGTRVFVQNGDTIGMEFNAIGLVWNGNSIYVQLVTTQRDFHFATQRVRSGYLDNAVRPPYKGDDTDGMGAEEGEPIKLVEPELGDRDPSTSQPVPHESESPAPELNHPTPVLTDAVLIPGDPTRPGSKITESNGIVVNDRQEELHTDVVWTSLPSKALSYSEATGGWLYKPNSVLQDSGLDMPDVLIRHAATHFSLAPVDVEVLHSATHFSLAPVGVEVSRAATHGTVDEIEFIPAEIRATYRAFTPDYLIRTGMIENLALMDFLRTLSAIHNTIKPDILRNGNEATKVTQPEGYDRPVWDPAGEVNADYRVGEGFIGHEVRVSYDRAKTKATWTVDAKYSYGVKRVNGLIQASYEKFVEDPTASVGVSYTSRVVRGKYVIGVSYGLRPNLRFQAGFSHQAEMRKLQGRFRVKANVNEYFIPRPVCFDDFVYSATDIRAWNTADAAIADGLAREHPIVYSKRMVDGFWAWHVPTEIERVDCAASAVMKTVTWGYVQGG